MAGVTERGRRSPPDAGDRPPIESLAVPPWREPALGGTHASTVTLTPHVCRFVTVTERARRSTPPPVGRGRVATLRLIRWTRPPNASDRPPTSQLPRWCPTCERIAHGGHSLDRHAHTPCGSFRNGGRGDEGMAAPPQERRGSATYDTSNTYATRTARRPSLATHDARARLSKTGCPRV